MADAVDTRTELQRKSDDLMRDRLKGMVPVVYPTAIGYSKSGAVFWTFARTGDEMTPGEEIFFVLMSVFGCLIVAVQITDRYDKWHLKQHQNKVLPFVAFFVLWYLLYQTLWSGFALVVAVAPFMTWLISTYGTVTMRVAVIIATIWLAGDALYDVFYRSKGKS